MADRGRKEVDGACPARTSLLDYPCRRDPRAAPVVFTPYLSYGSGWLGLGAAGYSADTISRLALSPLQQPSIPLALASHPIAE